VRRIPQLAAAFVLVTIVFGVSILGVGIYKASVDQDGEAVDKPKWEKVGSVIRRGIPPRIQQRFHLWLQGGEPPNPREVEWWGKIVQDNGLQIGDIDEDKVSKFENEELWYNNYAYQPSQALYGISDGLLLGRGLGRGYPESVPVADSDFIYAAVAEEMGLLGGAVLLVAYLLLMVGGMRTAIEARDMFTKLLAAGITFFLGFQAIVNIGGVVKMLPMTGITLPFVSHGGWSLITSFVMLGMLMAISHRNQTVKL
jgi:cell division protein FtsW (lipid II flippase)